LQDEFVVGFILSAAKDLTVPILAG